MDQKSEDTLYSRFETETEFTACSPTFTQPQIDFLIQEDYIEKTDASTLSGWAYILRPTYTGKMYFVQKKEATKAKIKHNIIEAVKFLIPTIISIIALVVSILK